MARLEGKVAVVVGGGQTPGQTIGNGRATALRFAQEGAKVAVLDNRLASAQDTVDLIEDRVVLRERLKSMLPKKKAV